MVALALLVALGAQPVAEPQAAAVALVHATGLNANESMGIAARVHQALKDARARVGMDPQKVLSRLGARATASEACVAGSDCAVVIGRRLGLGAIVAVDASAGRRSCAVHLEAISLPDGARLIERDLMTSREGFSAQDQATLAAFAHDAAAALALVLGPPPDLAATDAPRAIEVRPAPPSPEEVPPEAVEVSAASAGPRPAVVGSAVGAGVTLAAAIALAAAGFQQEQLLQPKAQMGMTWTTANDVAGRANTLYGSAGGAAGAAVVLAAIALGLHLAGP